MVIIYRSMSIINSCHETLYTYLSFCIQEFSLCIYDGTKCPRKFVKCTEKSNSLTNSEWLQSLH